MAGNQSNQDSKRSHFEKILNSVAIISVLAVLAFMAVNWSSLPQTIPIHFDISGKPDGWGSRWLIGIPILIGVLLWFGMGFLERIPEKHNYLWINEENKQKQYRNSQFFLNVLKNVILIFLSIITFQHIRLVLSMKDLLSPTVGLVFFLFLVGTIGVFLYNSYRLK